MCLSYRLQNYLVISPVRSCVACELLNGVRSIESRCRREYKARAISKRSRDFQHFTIH